MLVAMLVGAVAVFFVARGSDGSKSWDKREQAGYVYRHASGETMTYTYDEAVTADALRRMLAFFAEHP